MSLKSIFGRWRSAPEVPRIPNDEALARRIASSSARFVVLLEEHDSLFLARLIEGNAREILLKASRPYFCLELPFDIMEIAERLSKERDDLDIRAPSNSPYVPLLKAAPDYIFPVSKQLQTFHEVMDEDNRALAAGEVSIFPVLREISFHETKSILGPSVPESFSLYVLYMALAGKVKNPAGTKSLFESILSAPHMQPVIDQLRAAHGGQQGLLKAIDQETDQLLDRIMYYRLHGQSDAQSVAYMLEKIVPDAKVVVKYGAAHGLFAGLDTVLVEQIKQQTQHRGQDGSQEHLMVVAPRNAEMIHAVISDYLKRGYKINDKVCVWDFAFQREWPVTEWYNSAKQIYGPLAPTITAPQFKLG